MQRRELAEPRPPGSRDWSWYHLRHEERAESGSWNDKTLAAVLGYSRETIRAAREGRQNLRGTPDLGESYDFGSIGREGGGRRIEFSLIGVLSGRLVVRDENAPSGLRFEGQP